MSNAYFGGLTAMCFVAVNIEYRKSCQKPRLNLLVNFVSPLKRLASKAKIYSNLLYDKYMAVEEMPVVLCFQLSFVVFT